MMLTPILSVLLLAPAQPKTAPLSGYYPKATVTAATRLDWTFTFTNRSLTEVPRETLGPDFDSTKQTYELFVPPRKNMKQPLGAVIFISTSDEPAGWKSFETICKKNNLVFIGPRGAGNNVPPARRSRIILDCFDDVRRQVPLDPDRTYISGLSGGARIACGIAFALPEYFGGVIPVVAGGDMRAEAWLRHRIIDRLSMAMITGQTDFNRGEVERWKAPFWSGIGIRTKVWVPDNGHSMPSATVLSEAIKWLDDGKEQRAAVAKKVPSSRAASDATPSSDAAAKAFLEDGMKLVKTKGMLYRGLMLVKGVAERWPETTAGKAALKTLREYEPNMDWQADDIAEQKLQLTAEARGLADYTLNGIPSGSPYEKSRPDMAKAAIQLWSLLVTDSPDSDLGKEGKKLITKLQPLADKGK